MQVDARLGVFEDVAAAAGDGRETLEAVRALAADLHPDAFEVASRKEKSVWWGWGPAKMKEGYAYAMPFKRYVNLGFFQGAALDDPTARLEGTGKMLRHIKLDSPASVMEADVRALFAAARDERKMALGL